MSIDLSAIEREADEIISKAREEARKIIEEAKKTAEKILSKPLPIDEVKR